MKRNNYISLIFSAILLLPIIFFPFSGDQSIFALGGNMLFDGFDLYRDYIDLKPPMVFIFYGFIGIFADLNEIGYRIFEFIWQLITLFWLLKTVKSNFDDISANASVIIYSMVYTSLNFSQTLQPEGFINLPVIIILSMIFENKLSNLKLILIGAMLGFITAFKFTLGIFLIIFLLNLYFEKDNMVKFIKQCFIIIISMGIVFLITFIPILNENSYNGFLNVIEYLSFYSNYPPLNIELIKESIIKLSVVFGDNLSISFLLLIAAGLFNYFEKGNKKIILIGNMIILSLFSVAVEKKFHEYHFLRMFIPLAIAAGIGFKEIYRKIKERDCNNYCKMISAAFLILMIVLSPLPRLFNIAKYPVYYFTDRDKYNVQFEWLGSSQILRNQYIEINRKIRENFGKNSQIILLATGSNQINTMLYPDYEISDFSQSTFYFGIETPDEWLDDIKEEIKFADALIIQNNDVNPMISGHAFSSLESAKNDEDINEILNKYFVQYYQTDNFIIFKKKLNE